MSENQWYYMQNKQSVGPFSEEQITTMVESGTLAKSTLVWKEGNEWKPAKEVLNIQTPPPLPHGGFLNVSLPSKDKMLTRAWELQPHPWRRYFARMLDLLVNAYITVALVGGAWYAIDEGSAENFFGLMEGDSGPIFNAIISAFAAMFLSAAFIGFTGTTLGKWLNGIRVTDEEGRPLGYKKAFKREIQVWMRGLGFGIPIVILFTCYSAYQKLMQSGRTKYDEELNVRVMYLGNSPLQIFLSVITVILISAIMTALSAV